MDGGVSVPAAATAHRPLQRVRHVAPRLKAYCIIDAIRERAAGFGERLSPQIKVKQYASICRYGPQTW